MNITKQKLKSELISWAKFIVLLTAAYFIITNSIGLTRVSGHSMDPTLKDGSILLLNKLSTYLGEPKYGDIVVIQEENKDYEIIKRVMGKSGDTVAIKDGIVYINHSPLPEIYTSGKSIDMQEVTVQEGYIFVMGDHRTPGESLDSRDPSVGQIPMTQIKGYSVVSIVPFYKIMKPLKL